MSSNKIKGDGVGESKTSGGCAGMVGGEEHDDFVSRTGRGEIPRR